MPFGWYGPGDVDGVVVVLDDVDIDAISQLDATLGAPDQLRKWTAPYDPRVRPWYANSKERFESEALDRLRTRQRLEALEELRSKERLAALEDTGRAQAAEPARRGRTARPRPRRRTPRS